MGLLICMIILTIITIVGLYVGGSVFEKYTRAELLKGLNKEYYSSLAEKEKAIKEVNGNKLVKKLAPLGVIWMVFCLFGCFTTIGANEVGVVFNSMAGGIQDETLSEGFQTKSIFSKVTTISTANRSIELQSTGQTKDSIYATFELTIVYKIETVDAGRFYKVTSTDDISGSQINSIVKESLQSATTQYDIYSVMGGDLENVRNMFQDTLKDRLYDRYYISLISASFNDIDAGPEIESVIKQKAEALQQIEINNANAEAAKIKAEADAAVKIIEIEAAAKAALLQANNDLERAIIENEKNIEIAKAEAEAIQIAADAEAYKLQAEKEAIATSISVLYKLHNDFDTNGNVTKENITYQECYDMIIASMFYDKWDGELPLYVTDGSLSVLLPGVTTDPTS